MANTIKIKKYVDIIEELEAQESGIKPGMLLALHTDGKVKKHAVDEGSVLPMFALEDELQGHDIDELYDSGSPVQVWIPVRGEQVLALLDDEEDITTGDFLQSAGNGRLKKWVADEFAAASDVTVTPQNIVGVALESIDLGSSTGDWPDTKRRIKVRIV